MPKTAIIKVIVLSLISYLFHLLFVLNFKVFSITTLITHSNILYYVFLMVLICASVLVTSFIYLNEKSEHFIYISISLILLNIFTGTFLLYKDLETSLASSILVNFSFIPGILIPISMRDTFIKPHAFMCFKRVIRYTALFVALVFALSFYFYEDLTLNNPTINKFFNNFLTQTSQRVLSLAGVNIDNIPVSSKPITEEDIINVEKKIQNELSSLTGENLEIYNQNKDLLDGLLNGVVSGKKEQLKAQQTQQQVAPWVSGVKSVIEEYLTKYNKLILITGSILVYLFVTTIFYFLGMIMVPFFSFIFMLLVKINIFEKTKKQIEVERIEL